MLQSKFKVLHLNKSGNNINSSITIYKRILKTEISLQYQYIFLWEGGQQIQHILFWKNVKVHRAKAETTGDNYCTLYI